MIRIRILVNNVAAESSGALTILESFYKAFAADPKNTYYLCVSKPAMKPLGNLHILNYAWIKRSWIHRLWFEIIILPRLANRFGIEKIISLQNILLINTKLPQELYLQQSLPFSDYRVSIFASPKIWVQQHVIGRLILRSVKIATRVIVQTNWMKQAVVRKCSIPPQRVDVTPPILHIEETFRFADVRNKRNFFYPAEPLHHKNHFVILQAMQRLVKQGISDFSVSFTFADDLLPSSLKKLVPGIENQLKFLGHLPRREVLKRYSKSVLVFASHVETYGLPLAEARYFGSPILAVAKPYSEEVLQGYDKVRYFGSNDEVKLAELMKQQIMAARETSKSSKQLSRVSNPKVRNIE